ncbi:hypothetical protein C7E24_21670 [Stenotrophomonas maltophilia]|nr:hypothetical protein C7E24_21670 [Stenotrophomonas maltophilia]
MGSFMAYSQIGGSAVPASPGPNGQPPGSTGGGQYEPNAPATHESQPMGVGSAVTPRLQGALTLRHHRLGLEEMRMAALHSEFDMHDKGGGGGR